MLIDIASHGIMTEGISNESTVIDLGAHDGTFSRQMVARFGCKVVAVDPSAEHCDRISKEADSISVVCAAVGAASGFVNFNVCENRMSSTICPVDGEPYVRIESVKCLTLETILRSQNISRVDVLKVDVEGAEVSIFESVSDEMLRAIGQITLEFHDFCGMITSSEADAIQERLKRLGFREICLSRTNRENVLFFNPRFCRVSAVAELRARVVTRNLLGLGRIWERRHDRRKAMQA